MNTKFWGPGEWVYLHTITFNYPETVDETDKDHIERRKYTKQQFEILQYTLPCKYCRRSFKKFLKKLPIDKHLKTRADLTLWLYRVHNMVNAKLRKQEFEAVEAKYDELVRAVESGKKRKRAAYAELKEFVAKNMITPEDPPFEEVCAKYEAQRATCNAPKTTAATVMASCRTLVSSSSAKKR